MSAVKMVYACAIFVIFVVAFGYADAENCAVTCACCKNGCLGGQCFGCIDGFWQLNCSSPCLDSHCQFCDQMSGKCYSRKCKTGYEFDELTKTCKSHSKCEGNSYGPNCDIPCSDGCLSKRCKQEDGTCSCLDGFVGPRCDICMTGRFGNKCQYFCSKGCVNGVCHRSNGACSCRPNFVGSNCESCLESKYGESCEHQCSKGCQNNRCSPINGHCDCLPGFRSPKCETCEIGKYGQNCDLECAVGCQGNLCSTQDGTCSCSDNFSGSKCDSCKEGKYGINCSFACSEGCQADTCSRSDGTCLCKPGFTSSRCESCVVGQWGTQCQLKCYSGCTDGVCKRDGSCDCISGFTNTRCDTCESGRYGTSCEHTCSVGCTASRCGHDGTCKCLPNFEGERCEYCRSGRWGDHCQYRCSNGCYSGICHRNDGSCDCKTGFIGTKCDICEAGRYGVSCSYNCSDGCQYQTCNKLDGACSCVARFSGTWCEICVAGFFGSHCQSRCSDGCQKGICGRNDGTCKCLPGFTGSNCDNCEPGKFGQQCQYNCSMGCLDRKCNKQDGTCQCLENFSGTTCNACAQSRYGPDCNRKCSNGCTNDECRREDGSCLCREKFSGRACERCEEGRYGSNCDRECSHGCSKVSCSRESGFCDCIAGYIGATCDKCEPGKFGHICQNQCSVGCLNKSCQMDDGSCSCKENFNGKLCNDCENGRYGLNCEHVCDPLCVDGHCNQETGSCVLRNATARCNGTRHGLECQYTCSQGCKSGICDPDHGACACEKGFTGETCAECEIGRYGQDCTETCPRNCRNNVCERINGECRDGCASTNITGRLCEGCIQGLYGERCRLQCSSSCKNTECFRYNGTCIHGCDENFTGATCRQCIEGRYGENCEKLCDLCTDDSCKAAAGACRFDSKGKPPQVSGQSDDGSEFDWTIPGVCFAVVLLLAGGFVTGFLVLRKKRQAVKPIEQKRVLCQQHNSNEVYENVWIAHDPVNGVYASIENSSDLLAEELPDPVEVSVPTVEDDFQATVIDVVIGNENEASAPDLDMLYAKPQSRSKRTQIDVNNLPDIVSCKPFEEFKTEFLSLPKTLQKPYSESQKPLNISKNRYRGIYPYDHSRVRIDEDPDFYINACYIDGYQQDNAYIASLGPTRKTTDDFETFWKMVWHHKTDKIVMLTNLIENAVEKCHKYWPDVNTSQKYGDYIVICTREHVFYEYTHRWIRILQEEEEHEVHHLHFTMWPDKSVPDDVTSLIDFQEKVNSIEDKLGGPIVVHCSAGVGRTGTYIALDRLTRESGSGKVDVYSCLQNMRDQRVNMVQTAEQYEFLHRCLALALTSTNDIIYRNTLLSEQPRPDAYFERLRQSLHETPDDASEETARECNRSLSDRNRTNADIPGDKWRPKLFLYRGMNDSDYVNAVTLNGFRDADKFILAQTPLPNTVQDFLSLVYQADVSCIVCLDDVSSKRKDVGSYLPVEGKTVKHGPFSITTEVMSSDDHCVEYELRLRLAEKAVSTEMKIRHFWYKNWADGKPIPDRPGEFLQTVDRVERYMQDQPTNQCILVHCLDGAQRCGMFSAVSLLLEKLHIDGQVNLLNTLRKVKLRRRQALSAQEQVKFCYQCIVTSLEAESEAPKSLYYDNFPAILTAYM